MIAGVPIITESFSLEEAQKKLDMVPVGVRIFIHRSKVSQVGRIIIPNASKEAELSEGIVVAVGDKCEIAKSGQYVLFGKYAGATMERNGISYIMINEDDILAFKKGERC